MAMLPDLRERATELEIMDDLAVGGAQLTTTLRQIRAINKLLGAAWPTLRGVVELWRAAGRPARLTLLDVGAGLGDMNEPILRWARRSGVELRVLLLDIHPDTCAAAAEYYRHEPRVSVVQGSLLELPVAGVDIVTSSLCLHHFPSEQLPAILRSLSAAARLGVVINDLHRQLFAWAFIWVATRLLTDNRMIQFDAPLSVRRGFRAADLCRLRQEASMPALRWSWRPFFRYLLVLPADAVGAGSDGE